MKKIVTYILILVICISLTSCFLREKMTMEEYMEKNQKLYDSISTSLADDNCTIKFSSRGNSLVLTANMTFEIEEERLEAVSDALEIAIEEAKEDYLNMLENVKKYVPDAESVIVEYYDSNNVLVASKELK